MAALLLAADVRAEDDAAQADVLADLARGRAAVVGALGEEGRGELGRGGGVHVLDKENEMNKR